MAAMQPYAWAHGLLHTIPGIDEVAAALILIEIGDDMAHMARSGSPERLASWAAPSPGNHESAGKRKSGRIATVAVNPFVFKQAVSLGDLLSFYAHVQRVGKTSVTVHIEVYAERNPADLQVVKVTDASLTYVAIDHDGKPRPLPPR